MDKGYQIVEPALLDPLAANRGNHVLSVAALSWLCEELRLALPEQAQHVEFHVIKATYMGSYPTIGLHYKDETYSDIGPRVEAEIDRILRETPVLRFMSFLSQNTDWKKTASNIMTTDL